MILNPKQKIEDLDVDIALDLIVQSVTLKSWVLTINPSFYFKQQSLIYASSFRKRRPKIKLVQGILKG